MIITRFAPSPTGFLHLGHALAAKVAFDFTKSRQGQFLLRFEDIDHTRVRPHFYQAIEEDLAWLDLQWDEVPWKQLDRIPQYQDALEQLKRLGVVYPCYCTRREIQNIVNAPQGPEGPLYPGTCRGGPTLEGDPAWRLDCKKAAALTGQLTFSDQRGGQIEVDPELLGDVVLARKDIATSYHLAVVVDDAAQQVSHVTRGEDLLPSTHVHRLLQALLKLPEPEYFHHELVLDENGQRLAKRNDALSIRSLREKGKTPAEVLRALSSSGRKLI